LGSVLSSAVCICKDAEMELAQMIQQEEITAHNDSIRLEPEELVKELRELLGAQLVAYMGGVRETRAVREWIEGEREPRPDALQRLRIAYRAAALLRLHESRRTVHAWFQGMNPMLGDRSPARVLREGDMESDGVAVLVAARSLATAA
jgi:hypothetical protein